MAIATVRAKTVIAFMGFIRLLFLTKCILALSRQSRKAAVAYELVRRSAVVRRHAGLLKNVVDDETGVDRLNTSDINRARKRAAKLGLSDQEIDHDEYVQKFGHKFYN